MVRQIHPYASSLLVVAVAVILSACAGPAPLIPMSPTSPVASTAIASSSATRVTRPRSTPIVATSSPTPTRTKRSTATPSLLTPTIRKTPAPTLEEKQKAQFVTDMLKMKDNCKLPCWWGIVPGSTRFQAAVDSLQQQGVNLYVVRDLAGALVVDVPHPAQLFDYRFWMEFHANKGVISWLEAGGETYNLTQSRRFASDWQRYSVSNILQEYGQPSAIGFVSGPPAERDAPVSYSLTILYDLLGFAIRYTGPAQFDNQSNVIYACPKFEQMNNIRLILVSPDDPASKSDSELTELGPTLEETIGMSIEEFYERFKNSASKGCLEFHLTTP